VSKRVNSSKADADDATLIERDDVATASASAAVSFRLCAAEQTYRNLVSCPNFPRHDAEFVGVPITDKHLDRGQHILAAAPSLRMPSPLGYQMIEQIDVFPVRIVSHHPVPPHNSTANFRANRGG
jgi:hypothetical protein